MTLNIIGSGNVATVLAKLAVSKGHQINNVYSRNISQAVALANAVQSKAVSSINKITNAAITIIAVNDGAIPEIIESLPVLHTLLVHTAGSVSIHAFKNSTESYGILYPLQSLRKEMQHMPEIPFLIDGNTAETINVLQEFAASLSPVVAVINDEERRKLHVAATISSNFTNYLYTIAEAFCIAENIDFSLLHPLIKETAERLQYASPKNLQTGPAARGDNKTIQAHLALLEAHPQIKNIYTLLNNALTDSKKTNNDQ